MRKFEKYGKGGKSWEERKSKIWLEIEVREFLGCLLVLELEFFFFLVVGFLVVGRKGGSLVEEDGDR